MIKFTEIIWIKTIFQLGELTLELIIQANLIKKQPETLESEIRSNLLCAR